ncbi:MAG: IS110 family transposase, partial [Acidobacteriota bacterium]
SIEVNRRSRRAKSDRLDAAALLGLLIRFHQGDERAFSTLRVPTPEQEDARHLHRHLKMLKRSRTRTINRIRGLLATQGVRLEKIQSGLQQGLKRLRDWEGRPLRPTTSTIHLY